MSWSYINEGTADTITLSSSGTKKNLPATQSRTRTAFYQTTQAKCFDLPSTEEIWIKFDVYCKGSIRWKAGYVSSNSTTGLSAEGASGESLSDLKILNNGQVVSTATGICKARMLQTVLLHMKASSMTYEEIGGEIKEKLIEGTIEARIDGMPVLGYSGDVNSRKNFDKIYLWSSSTNTLFSNVIISDGAVSGDIRGSNCEIQPYNYILASWIPNGRIYFQPFIFMLGKFIYFLN